LRKAARLVRRGLELDRLDVELAGTIGLVAVPVLDHELAIWRSTNSSSAPSLVCSLTTA
jgi:hypothetical protein